MEIQLFWHVAAIGAWEEIASEQQELFNAIGLKPMVGIVGSIPPTHPVRVNNVVVYESDDIRKFETPTIQKVWEWCRWPNRSPDDVAIYCHTKGASRPGPIRTEWRKLMHKYLVVPWRQNVEMTATCDVVGWNYCDKPAPHFSGNFWIARADWIQRLPSPIEHRGQRSDRRVRFHAERWLLSVAGFTHKSLGCENVRVFKNPSALRKMYREECLP